jgi:hypothetical protein
MPYPESCPECGSTFRNTGTHFTARRNEIGRHVLLELGCQNTTRRFWWDFTTGNVTEEGRPSTARRAPQADAVGAGAATNGAFRAEGIGSFQVETNGHAALSTLAPPQTLAPQSSSRDLAKDLDPEGSPPIVAQKPVESGPSRPDLPLGLELNVMVDESVSAMAPRRDLGSLALDAPGVDETSDSPATAEPAPEAQSHMAALLGPPPGASTSLKDAFVRQLQLDRLTLRQMRSWLMSEEARRAVEVAAGATEATYERLALILFGSELPHLLGKPSAAPQSTGMSAEDRLELQREKARIRARLRRAAAKAARQGE